MTGSKIVRIIANWKMYSSSRLCSELKVACDNWEQILSSTNIQLVICPSFPYLEALNSSFNGYRNITLGAQNCFSADSGAYTGEVSCMMLRELGCQYVIVGHSERRTVFHENNDEIIKKTAIAQKYGITPILCIGEPADIYNTHQSAQYLLDQVAKIARSCIDIASLVIAYEPLWAIGTGIIPDPAYIEVSVDNIKKALDNVEVLYGGSVNAKSINQILTVKNISGVLIGGASTDIREMKKIIKFYIHHVDKTNG
ncbi:Triosephosphate isomerase [Alphaproteobacteria bacterium]